MSDRESEKLLVKALLTVAFSAGATAALSKDQWLTIFKNFIAGMCAGIVVYIIGSTAALNPTWLLIACFVFSAFVSSLWPVVGEIARKHLLKKGSDVVHDTE